MLFRSFGPGILTADGEMDRPKVGKIVFNDEAKRKVLEGIVHPLIFERSAALEASAPKDGVVIHDIPLLAESGRADTFDAVIVVETPAMWWPSIAERPKVGFRPVRPQ